MTRDGKKIKLHQGCTNPGCQVAWATKFYTVAPNIRGSLVRNLFHVTLLATKNLRWFNDFKKIMGPADTQNVQIYLMRRVGLKLLQYQRRNAMIFIEPMKVQ